MRIGYGVDFHKFKKGRKLVLGGIEIPSPLGLDGHSDADVMTHAVCDALLGAAALGDIGEHFPDTDRRYKDISSILLLEHVVKLLIKRKLKIVNIDIVLLMEKPKILPYKKKMKKELCRATGLKPDYLNIKATTTEKMGAIGRLEGSECRAVALIEKYRR
jgi:2-C-methyl-D-erythritol 2,4-cyclodiphosphate synthase